MPPFTSDPLQKASKAAFDDITAPAVGVVSKLCFFLTTSLILRQAANTGGIIVSHLLCGYANSCTVHAFWQKEKTYFK